MTDRNEIINDNGSAQKPDPLREATNSLPAGSEQEREQQGRAQMFRENSTGVFVESITDVIELLSRDLYRFFGDYRQEIVAWCAKIASCVDSPLMGTSSLSSEDISVLTERMIDCLEHGYGLVDQIASRELERLLAEDEKNQDELEHEEDVDGEGNAPGDDREELEELRDIAALSRAQAIMALRVFLSQEQGTLNFTAKDLLVACAEICDIRISDSSNAAKAAVSSPLLYEPSLATQIIERAAQTLENVHRGLLELGNVHVNGSAEAGSEELCVRLLPGSRGSGEDASIRQLREIVCADLRVHAGESTNGEVILGRVFPFVDKTLRERLELMLDLQLLRLAQKFPGVRLRSEITNQEKGLWVGCRINFPGCNEEPRAVHSDTQTVTVMSNRLESELGAEQPRSNYVVLGAAKGATGRTTVVLPKRFLMPGKKSRVGDHSEIMANCLRALDWAPAASQICINVVDTRSMGKARDTLLKGKAKSSFDVNFYAGPPADGPIDHYSPAARLKWIAKVTQARVECMDRVLNQASREAPVFRAPVEWMQDAGFMETVEQLASQVRFRGLDLVGFGRGQDGLIAAKELLQAMYAQLLEVRDDLSQHDTVQLHVVTIDRASTTSAHGERVMFYLTDSRDGLSGIGEVFHPKNTNGRSSIKILRPMLSTKIGSVPRIMFDALTDPSLTAMPAPLKLRLALENSSIYLEERLVDDVAGLLALRYPLVDLEDIRLALYQRIVKRMLTAGTSEPVAIYQDWKVAGSEKRYTLMIMEPKTIISFL